METPAKRLKFARQLRGMNQVRLATAAGVATGTVGNIEAGTRGIDGSALKLAKALNVDPNWLATGEGPAPGAEASQAQPVAEQGQPSLAQALEVLAKRIALAGSSKQDNLINLMALLVRNPGNPLYTAAIEAELKLTPRFETNHAAGLPPTVTTNKPHEPV